MLYAMLHALPVLRITARRDEGWMRAFENGQLFYGGHQIFEMSKVKPEP